MAQVPLTISKDWQSQVFTTENGLEVSIVNTEKEGGEETKKTNQTKKIPPPLFTSCFYNLCDSLISKFPSEMRKLKILGTAYLLSLCQKHPKGYS